MFSKSFDKLAAASYLLILHDDAERGKARHEWPTSRIRTSGAGHRGSNALENPRHPGRMRHGPYFDVAAAARADGPRRSAVPRRRALGEYAGALPRRGHHVVAVSVARASHAEHG